MKRWRASGNIALCLLALVALKLSLQPAFSQMGEQARTQALKTVPVSELSGWDKDNPADAFAAFRRSCGEMSETGRGFLSRPQFGGRRADWLGVCRNALTMPTTVPQRTARQFFEHNFVALAIESQDGESGVFTGYFEPEVDGSTTPQGPYHIPLYAKPRDLVLFDPSTRKRLGACCGRMVNGRPQAYFTRAEIEAGALSGRGLEFVWLKSARDAFFLQIQGSGRIRLEDGGVMRVGFAAKNGQPYTAIGRILVEAGEISRKNLSMQTIRAWLKTNPDQARPLMNRNESFIFFRIVKGMDPQLGPLGAEGVQLTPGRSLAVDKSRYGLGMPIWLETTAPTGKDGTLAPMRRLVVAQDTGAAIKGLLRGDVFWGSGARAANIAGRMNSPGHITVLVPRRLGRDVRS